MRRTLVLRAVFLDSSYHKIEYPRTRLRRKQVGMKEVPGTSMYLVPGTWYVFTALILHSEKITKHAGISAAYRSYYAFRPMHGAIIMQRFLRQDNHGRPLKGASV